LTSKNGAQKRAEKMQNEWWQQLGEAMGKLFARYNDDIEQFIMPGGGCLYEWRAERWHSNGLFERYRVAIEKGNGFSIEKAAKEIERKLG
jgi:hypothetical protein